MSLTASRRLVPQLVELDAVGSTNTELVARAADAALPGFTTIVTRDQTSGRGRLDRRWVAPRGTGLAISVLVRLVGSDGAPLAPQQLGWLPIAAGLAMSAAVAELLPARSVGLKWPNDVLVAGRPGDPRTERKVCGVLSELVPAGGAVLGAGLNLSADAEQLPVATATSLVLEGADPGTGEPGAAEGGDDLADRALSGYLTRLIRLCEDYAAAGADADRSGLRDAARSGCLTLGRDVRVESPGADPLPARAVDLDETGRLVVRPIRADGSLAEPTSVSAGDIVHLRHG